jgi:hypothetical protein
LWDFQLSTYYKLTWSQLSHFKAKKGKKSRSESQIQIFLMTVRELVAGEDGGLMCGEAPRRPMIDGVQ